jgi:hypothetical protein
MALSASTAFASIPVINHPADGGFYPISQAYFASAERGNELNDAWHDYGSDNDIEDNKCYTGADGATGNENTTAAPGALCLITVDNRLDADAFATCDHDDMLDPNEVYVQSFRLKKTLPDSVKCPGVFHAQNYYMFGSEGVRTWWTLIYSPPGTTFTLDVTVRCVDKMTQFPKLHIDRWHWKVVATLDSLRAVIDVLHSNTLGTTEIPCIASEEVYDMLHDCVDDIQAPVAAGLDDEFEGPTNRFNAQEALFKAEAFVVAFCAFGDCLDTISLIPGLNYFDTFPPGNGVQAGEFGMTGILDTPENPCCCKLLVDLEKIAEYYGIISL